MTFRTKLLVITSLSVAGAVALVTGAVALSTRRAFERIDQARREDVRNHQLGDLVAREVAEESRSRVETDEAPREAARRLPPAALFAVGDTDLDPDVVAPRDGERAEAVGGERALVANAPGGAEHRVGGDRAVLVLRERGAVTWEKFRGGREGSLWYYRTLADFFKTTNLPRGLVEELLRTVATMEQLAAQSG